MDLVLVGLPGSGKSVVGRRLAQRHGATYIDLDGVIEREDGRSIPTIFAEDGEPAFRALERAAVAGLGPADPDPEVRRVIASGGGTVVDPRNRWRCSVGVARSGSTVDRRSSPSGSVARPTSGPSSPAVIRSGRCATSPPDANGSTPPPTCASAGVADVGTSSRPSNAPGRPTGRRRDAPARGHADRATDPRRRDRRVGHARRPRAVEARRAVIVSEPGAWEAVGAASRTGWQRAV